MKKIYLLGLFLVLGNVLHAAPMFVQMFYIGQMGSPGWFIWDVDETRRLLLCDQREPNVSTEPYTARVATLADLTGTQLLRQGMDAAEALQRYTQVAILSKLAYENPALAGDVILANRHIVDGSGALLPGPQSLLNWVQTQNAASYDLTGFMIFAPVSAISQEQVGYFVPEPSTIVLIGFGLVGVTFGTWRRRGRASRS